MKPQTYLMFIFDSEEFVHCKRQLVQVVVKLTEKNIVDIHDR